MVRRRVVVSGRVQGVFFRDTCRQVAAAHDVAGWVRNLPDGTVEAVFEGHPAAVEALVTWAHQGPDAAHVDSVQEHEERPEGVRGFQLR